MIRFSWNTTRSGNKLECLFTENGLQVCNELITDIIPTTWSGNPFGLAIVIIVPTRCTKAHQYCRTILLKERISDGKPTIRISSGYVIFAVVKIRWWYGDTTPD